jgi:hypothetical protein
MDIEADGGRLTDRQYLALLLAEYEATRDDERSFGAVSAALGSIAIAIVAAVGIVLREPKPVVSAPVSALAALGAYSVTGFQLWLASNSNARVVWLRRLEVEILLRTQTAGPPVPATLSIIRPLAQGRGPGLPLRLLLLLAVPITYAIFAGSITVWSLGKLAGTQQCVGIVIAALLWGLLVWAWIVGFFSVDRIVDEGLTKLTIDAERRAANPSRADET